MSWTWESTKAYWNAIRAFLHVETEVEAVHVEDSLRNVLPAVDWEYSDAGYIIRYAHEAAKLCVEADRMFVSSTNIRRTRCLSGEECRQLACTEGVALYNQQYAARLEKKSGELLFRLLGEEERQGGLFAEALVVARLSAQRAARSARLVE